MDQADQPRDSGDELLALIEVESFMNWKWMDFHNPRCDRPLNIFLKNVLNEDDLAFFDNLFKWAKNNS